MEEAERFDKPEKDISADDFLMKFTQLKDKVPLTNNPEDLSD